MLAKRSARKKRAEARAKAAPESQGGKEGLEESESWRPAREELKQELGKKQKQKLSKPRSRAERRQGKRKLLNGHAERLRGPVDCRETRDFRRAASTQGVEASAFGLAGVICGRNATEAIQQPLYARSGLLRLRSQ